jgi:hypothetical protein
MPFIKFNKPHLLRVHLDVLVGIYLPAHLFIFPQAHSDVVISTGVGLMV